MHIFREFEEVRLKVPIQRRCGYGEETIHSFPAGTLCAIIDILAGGEAFLVEFALSEPQFGEDGEVLDAGEFCIITLTPDYLEHVT